MFYNHSKEMSVAVGLAYWRFGLALSHIAQDSRKVKDAAALIPVTLHFMYERVSDLAYFRILVSDAEKIPLFEAAASLAQDEYPRLDLENVLSTLEQLGRRLSERCRNLSTELKRLQETSRFFHKELGFSGNVNNYYDPDNSFMHKVLETRRGIPITLAIIYIELARTVGLDAEGVSFPGHFLVKINLHEGPVVLDPFTGQSLSKENLLERLEPYRQSFGLTDDSEVPIGKFLQPAEPKDILLRMLRNLREIYSQQDRPEKVKKVVERIQVLNSKTNPG
jgi:regulator of sirC expression with transglutaminase-like and TPR domain